MKWSPSETGRRSCGRTGAMSWDPVSRGERRENWEPLMYSSAGLGKEFGVYSKCPVVWIKPGKLTLWHLSHPHCSASRPTISSSSKLKVSLRPSECQLCYLQTSTLLCPLSPHDYSVQPTVRDGHLCMSRCLGWGD